MSTCVHSETLCDASSDYYCVAGKSGHPCAPGDEINDMCLLDYGPDGTSKGCVPPNLINTLISIALSPGSCDEPMFRGQAVVQTFVLLVAFMAVPVLLFGKPCVLANSSHEHGHGHSDVEMTQMGEEEEEEEEHSFGEMMIHQAIETIEFVLGMVSNTASCAHARALGAASVSLFPLFYERVPRARARTSIHSYLRLWALSLAHGELASVFWDKAMLVAIQTNNPVFIFAGYAVFASVTAGVLLAMDVLEVRGSVAVAPSRALVRSALARRLIFSVARARALAVLPTRAASALGRVPEQVLQGGRVQVPAVSFQADPGSVDGDVRGRARDGEGARARPARL